MFNLCPYEACEEFSINPFPVWRPQLKYRPNSVCGWNWKEGGGEIILNYFSFDRCFSYTGYTGFKSCRHKYKTKTVNFSLATRELKVLEFQNSSITFVNTVGKNPSHAIAPFICFYSNAHMFIAACVITWHQDFLILYLMFKFLITNSGHVVVCFRNIINLLA